MIVDARRNRSKNSERIGSLNLSRGALALMRGSFSAQKISRKYPVLAGLHRGIDGGLIGVLLCAALMSALALHSQYLWRLSFSRLEITRDLTHRLEESIANLEIYLLNSVISPKTVVETKSTDLIYIDPPINDSHIYKNSSDNIDYYHGLLSHPVTYGY